MNGRGRRSAELARCAANETNFRVRNCRLCHLKSLDPLALLVVVSLRRHPSLQFNHGGIGMNNRLLSCFVAGALATALALASPALARGGGHGGGMGGGHFGGMAGGHFGGMGGGHWGGMHSSGMHSFASIGGGAHFSGARFAGARFAHAGFSPRFSRFAFHHRFHHRFNRFAFVGVPFAYAAYDSCWRRVWTPYGLQWIDVCGDYGYY
jgi:hypothetical protein